MGAGRILYEDWSCPKLDALVIYQCEIFIGTLHRLCLVTNLDLSGILGGIACEVNQEQLKIISEFSNMIHSVTFGTESPVIIFQFFLCVSDVNGNLDFEFMKAIVTSSDLKLINDGNHPTLPFIVYSTTSNRLHRVDQVLDTEPSSFRLPTANWKPLAECGLNQQTLADYYMNKYKINVHEKQSIFVSPMGNLIQPVDLVPTHQPPNDAGPIRETNPKNLLYLIPQLVRISPLTHIMNQLPLVPRFLFWIERGVIARDVAQTMGVDTENRCHDEAVFNKVVPPEFLQYESRALSLISIAVTCPGADLPYNYDRMEWLGDSVLRRVVVDEFKVSPKIINEVLSNDRMGKLCQESCPKIAERCVLSSKPSLRNPAACRSKLRNFRILADIVEALICASFIIGGIPAASNAARALGLVTENDLKTTSTTPASVRLQQSLEALRKSDTSTSVGELDSTRNTLVRDIYVSD